MLFQPSFRTVMIGCGLIVVGNDATSTCYRTSGGNYFNSPSLKTVADLLRKMNLQASQRNEPKERRAFEWQRDGIRP